MREARQRVVVVGLDCLEPSLVFDRWREELPVLGALMARGTWGRLRSTDPPITVPAWAAMTSGRDPGELGHYGFRHRRSRAFGDVELPHSGTVTAPRLWDLASAAGLECLVVGVPQTWPPRPISGALVSGFLAPDAEADFTWPPGLADEVRQRAGEWHFDVEGFRGAGADAVHRAVVEMSEQRFGLFAAWLTERRPDFAMVVDMGPDRLQHAAWGERDDLLLDYHRQLDRHLGEVVAAAGDDAALLVVSDHGAQTMEGAVRINEWLRQEGWLVLRTSPPAGEATPLSRCEVDWSRTRAWGEGGYCGRVHLNVAGRDPEGVLPPEAVEDALAELTAGLSRIRGPEGKVAATRVLRPGEVYRKTRGFPPDLIVYFDDLRWRALGTLGPQEVWTRENDTGPDGANHALHGVFVLADPRRAGEGELTGLVLWDVFATVCDRLGLDPPASTLGTPRG